MSDTPRVTRSTAAFTAAAAGRVSRQRQAQPSGWWGMALFLCSEVTLFGTLIATYFYLDFDAPAGRRGGSRRLASCCRWSPPPRW